MTTLVVPPLEARPWLTLGPQVCEFIEDELIFGPGDLRGQPARLDDEKRALIYRMYEVYPREHARAGRRRFKRVALSLRKGTAKTELAAWIAACELHPEAPVRCDGWRRRGRGWEPVGAPVRDPYIPMVAYTEEQTEELAYSALYVILSEGPLAEDFDIGIERIMRLGGDGKAVALASAPDSRDGARTTFEHFDETHRFVLPRLIEAHQTMMANLPKRKLADAWALETTTSPAPGEGSVAERTMEYAQAVAEGRVADPRLFFFHRQASEHHNLNTKRGIRAAIVEASGPAAKWSDIDAIVSLYQDPTTDRRYFERVWLNRPIQQAAQAFDAAQWGKLADPHEIAEQTLIVIGFDGSRYRDATALIGTEVESGYQWPLGIWERPPRVAEWEVPEEEVSRTVAEAFGFYHVWRLYGDPFFWEATLASWAGLYGDDRVITWDTRRTRPMAYAVRSFADAIKTGTISHDGSAQFARHVGNTQRRDVKMLDEEGQPMFTICKERDDSPHKIDAAAAAVLSWQARNDALSAGAVVTQLEGVLMA